MFHNFDGHGWGMGWGWIFGLLILIILVWLFYKTNSLGKRKNVKRKSALEILKERYARGEIDKKEFEERKKEL